MTYFSSVSVERVTDYTAAKEAGLTTEELPQSIQASKSELFDALKRSCAIKLNDKFEMENIYM